MSAAFAGPRDRVVVVGNGMAGSRVVEELRAHDPGHLLHLTVLGEEAEAAYNRVLLSEVLAGRHRADDIRLGATTWTDQHAVDQRLGAPATGIDREKRQVRTSTGGVVDYDVLVLATGSRAALPPIDGLTGPGGELLPGGFVFRTLEDCRRIDAAATGARRAVVLGGGLLGLEAARGLAGRGLDVIVVHAVDHLMDRQLDPAAGAILRRSLGDLGVQVRTGVATTGVLRRHRRAVRRPASRRRGSGARRPPRRVLRSAPRGRRRPRLPVSRSTVVSSSATTCSP